MNLGVAAAPEVGGERADKNLRVLRARRVSPELMCCDVEMSETNKTNSGMRNFKTVK